MTHSEEKAGEVGLFGIMAHFSSPEALQEVAKAAYDSGFRNMDSYSPFPIEGLAEMMGKKRTRLPWLVFFAGLTGLIGGLALQIFTSAVDYPINIGGRPLVSLPSFIPIAYECTILFAALSSGFGMLMINGFPQPYHPVFNVKEFVQSGSCDGFFLCIESTDPHFSEKAVRSFFEKFHPVGVFDVPK